MVSSTWSDRPQAPLTEKVLGLGGPWLQPARAGLHISLLGVGPRGLGAVVQEAVGGHHLCVALLTPTHSTLVDTGEAGGLVQS